MKLVFLINGSTKLRSLWQAISDQNSMTKRQKFDMQLEGRSLVQRYQTLALSLSYHSHCFSKFTSLLYGTSNQNRTTLGSGGGGGGPPTNLMDLPVENNDSQDVHQLKNNSSPAQHRTPVSFSSKYFSWNVSFIFHLYISK